INLATGRQQPAFRREGQGIGPGVLAHDMIDLLAARHFPDADHIIGAKRCITGFTSAYPILVHPGARLVTSRGNSTGEQAAIGRKGRNLGEFIARILESAAESAGSRIPQVGCSLPSLQGSTPCEESSIW